MPSLLFINRVYPPEAGATGRVLEYMAEGFACAGWNVSVLTTAGGKAISGNSTRNGVKIIRIGGMFSKRSLIARALGYALMIPVFFCKAVLLPRADVVVTMTDPPMLLVIGPLLRLLKGSRLIHWAQDLYPEVAVELGIFSAGSSITKLLRFLSSRAMRWHDRMVVVGRCMVSRLRNRGIPREAICVIPNAGVEQEIIPVPHASNSFRHQHGLEPFFVVEYSGNLGMAHEFETVMEAARRLQDVGEDDVLFLFVGGGPRENELKITVQKLGLKNIRFLAAQSDELLGESLSAADLHLVTMKNEMEGLVVPSKFYGVMAAGRPCLFVGPAASEVALVIVDSGAGTIFSPGDTSGLVASILEYRDDSELLAMTGVKAGECLKDQDSLRLFIDCAAELLPA